MRSRLPNLLAPLFCLFARTASAQEIQGEEPAPAISQDIEYSAGSPRSYAKDWLVNPDRELEVGGTLRFLTAPESPIVPPGTMGDDGELRFTDVGLFRPAFRLSFAKRLELSGGVDLLVKRPSYAGEPVFYGGDLGLRVGLAEAWALFVRGAAGPMLAGLGAWAEASAGLQARASIDETIRLQGALGGAVTPLFQAEGPAPWFAEVVTHGEVVFRTPRGEVAGWLGADYRVPVARVDPAGGIDIDPAVRLGFQLGGTLSYVKSWDLFAVLAVIDRGDAQNPPTTLPILDGGFDQTQLVFGVAHRFDLEGAKEREVYRRVY